MASCHLFAEAKSNRLLVKEGRTLLLILASKVKRLFKCYFLQRYTQNEKAASPQTAFQITYRPKLVIRKR